MQGLRRHLTFSNVIACVALFAALGGIAWALERNSVKSRHIVNGQVKDRDLRSFYQFGNGIDGAWANFVDDGQSDLVFSLTGGGVLVLNCAAAPTLSYTNNSRVPADVWLDDDHSVVNDEDTAELGLPASGQVDLQIWTTAINTVDLSVHYDAGALQCAYAASKQDNFEDPFLRRGEGAKRALDGARGGKPSKLGVR